MKLWGELPLLIDAPETKPCPTKSFISIWTSELLQQAARPQDCSHSTLRHMNQGKGRKTLW